MNYQTTTENYHPGKVAFVGNYLPRRCGIATFTYDVYQSYASQYPHTNSFVVAVNDQEEGYEYPSEVRMEFFQNDAALYERTAEFINHQGVEIVCLQHEYGIYGGPNGKYILRMLRKLQMPVVTTLHTVLKEPSPHQYQILKEIADRSARLIVMTERGKRFLTDIYGVSAAKIDVIPHGIPDIPFIDTSFYKEEFGLSGKRVLLTFGLISPGKGLDSVIRALPAVVDKHPDLVYLIVGATHPNLLREQGETYRNGLLQLAKELGVEKNVQFHNQFVDIEKLKEYIGLADIYITPYLNPAQITSGTLAYCFGSGKAVISTPYWHAEELLADNHGLLVPFNDSEAITKALNDLLTNETKRNQLRRKAFVLGREMIWEKVIHRFNASFAKARSARIYHSASNAAVELNTYATHQLPELNLTHLYRFTDNVGIFQHARYSLPHYDEGYCTDDNVRALVLTLTLTQHNLIVDKRLDWLTDIYCAFINHAYAPTHKVFKNFLSFDRRWLEEKGSDDSNGRTLWAMGTLINHDTRPDIHQWAVELFDQVLPSVVAMTSPRAWAFTLLGIHAYLQHYPGDRKVAGIRQVLTQKLLNCYYSAHQTHWQWFEPIVTYDNARLCQALLLSGSEEGKRVGLLTLQWLTDTQKAPEGHFRPIGSEGFFEINGARAAFDQQPLEAGATVSACLTAFQLTRETQWIDEAWRAFNWFMGDNDLKQPMYDAISGGCNDGMHRDRINQNKGAESLLTYLMALAEMTVIQNDLRPAQPRPLPTKQELILS